MYIQNNLIDKDYIKLMNCRSTCSDYSGTLLLLTYHPTVKAPCCVSIASLLLVRLLKLPNDQPLKTPAMERNPEWFSVVNTSNGLPWLKECQC